MRVIFDLHRVAFCRVGIGGGHGESGGLQMLQEVDRAGAKAEGVGLTRLDEDLAGALEQGGGAAKDGEFGAFDVDLQKIALRQLREEAVEGGGTNAEGET